MRKNTVQELHKFPNRIVLGCGYPWAIGSAGSSMGDTVTTLVGMCDAPTEVNLQGMVFPEILWCQHVPQYRLVLEKK